MNRPRWYFPSDPMAFVSSPSLKQLIWFQHDRHVHVVLRSTWHGECIHITTFAVVQIEPLVVSSSSALLPLQLLSRCTYFVFLTPSFSTPSPSPLCQMDVSVEHSAASGIVGKLHRLFKNRPGSHTAGHFSPEVEVEWGGWWPEALFHVENKL